MKNSGLHLITLHVTSKCNLNCLHCYSKNIIKTKNLSFPEIKKIILEAKKMGVTSLHIEGGEPLLRSDIFKIIKLIKNHKFHLELTTNGTLIKKYHTPFFKKYKLDKIILSVDGHNAEIHDTIRGKGNFKKTMRGLKYCLETNLSTGISFTVTSLNALFIEKSIKKFLKLPIAFLNFRRFIPVGSGKMNKHLSISSNQYKKVFLTILKNYQTDKRIGMTGEPLRFFFNKNNKTIADKGGCMAGRALLNINYNGDITPCMFLPIKIGNIRTQKLIDIWNKNLILEKLRNKSKYLKGKCKKCKFKMVCGGCRASAFACEKDLFQSDPLCWF